MTPNKTCKDENIPYQNRSLWEGWKEYILNTIDFYIHNASTPNCATNLGFVFHRRRRDNQFLTDPTSPLSKSTHFNLVLFPNIPPSFDRNNGFIMRGWRNHSSIHDGRDWTKLCFNSHHAFMIPLKKGELVYLDPYCIRLMVCIPLLSNSRGEEMKTISSP